jgi:hypothetical protein
LCKQGKHGIRQSVQGGKLRPFTHSFTGGASGMSHIQFLVVRQGGKWSVRSQDQHRSFADQQAATRAAVDLANHSGKDGKPAVVIVELGKGRFETVWTYGEDANPPSKFDLPVAEEPPTTAASE